MRESIGRGLYPPIRAAFVHLCAPAPPVSPESKFTFTAVTNSLNYSVVNAQNSFLIVHLVEIMIESCAEDKSAESE